jgi:hypothetical protein
MRSAQPRNLARSSLRNRIKAFRDGLAAQAAKESFERSLCGPHQVRCVGPGQGLFRANLDQIDFPAKFGDRQDGARFGATQDRLLNMRHRIRSANENGSGVDYQVNPTLSR